MLLESQRQAGLWEPVNGAVDGGETLLEAALREVREEAGQHLRVRPLGVVHASTFEYDARVRRMIWGRSRGPGDRALPRLFLGPEAA